MVILNGVMLYHDNPALVARVNSVFNRDTFYRWLSIESSRIRSLKYFKPIVYEQYLYGIKNYRDIQFSENIRELIDKYSLELQRLDVGAINDLREKILHAILTISHEPEQAGALLGYLSEGIETLMT